MTCYFGSAWGVNGCGPCRHCRREADRMEREFWRRVFFGEYDVHGYTPAENAKGTQR